MGITPLTPMHAFKSTPDHLRRLGRHLHLLCHQQLFGIHPQIQGSDAVLLPEYPPIHDELRITIQLDGVMVEWRIDRYLIYRLTHVCLGGQTPMKVSGTLGEWLDEVTETDIIEGVCEGIRHLGLVMNWRFAIDPMITHRGKGMSWHYIWNGEVIGGMSVLFPPMDWRD